MPPETVIFAGPTRWELDGAAALPPGARWEAPVRRGDLTRLARLHAPGTIVLVDGLFHHTLAVGHAEIRGALARGWAVYGLGSMGAIRACEMRDLGVRGFGNVYRRFVADPELRDDEVALLHESEPPYRALSEPLLRLVMAIAG